MWSILQSLRKFGPQYYDLPTMLSNVSAMLRLLALNIDGRNKKKIPIIFVISTVVSSILYIYAYVLCAFWYAFWRGPAIGDVSGAFIEFSLNITSEISVVKLFYMLYYEEKLKILTNKYLALDARIVKGSRFSNNMLKSLKEVKRRGIIYWMTVMVDASIYVSKPHFTPGRHLTVDMFIIYGLEPMFESPNFELASVIMTISVLFICYIVANVACFLILVIGYIEATMLTLSEEMIHLYDDAVDHYKKTIVTNYELKPIVYTNANKSTKDKIINQYIKKQLTDIIAKHAMNISYLKEIDEIMRGPNAVGFLFLVTGLTAELLGGLKNTCLQIPFTMLQLSVDCYLGQKVMDANIKFEQAVYACKWEKFDVSNRKIILMMLQNSQKTITLTAGGIAILNFNCLMSIIKITYSVYTTLRSMV